MKFFSFFPIQEKNHPKKTKTVEQKINPQKIEFRI